MLINTKSINKQTYNKNFEKPDERNADYRRVYPQTFSSDLLNLTTVSVSKEQTDYRPVYQQTDSTVLLNLTKETPTTVRFISKQTAKPC